MDFKVIFSDSFLEDLEGILKLVALENPSAAQKLGQRIVRTAETLSFFPERFPMVRQRPGIRRFITMKRFKVFYRVHPNFKTVEILRCWDGRRRANPSFES